MTKRQNPRPSGFIVTPDAVSPPWSELFKASLQGVIAAGIQEKRVAIDLAVDWADAAQAVLVERRKAELRPNAPSCPSCGRTNAELAMRPSPTDPRSWGEAVPCEDVWHGKPVIQDETARDSNHPPVGSESGYKP